eukprot:TRINITY_DN87954_c0_g1_i1.p1 TRINITY_DN87954_c0_g1~~TRINITY_DN87954_c0_g1_i1.p1  ORF type:complete len:123 (-),score=21.72 TRINITY_DN87954_c0_g1_i1:31-399(-)
MTSSHYADFVKLQSNSALNVVVFPCNQFGAQEPGTPQEIKAFAESQGLKVNSGNFWMMGKVDVNGPNQHPVYTFLKQHSSDAAIQWNFFTKFVVRCGETECDITRHDGQMVPSSLVSRAGEL